MQHYGAIRHPPANGRSRPFAWMALLKQAGLTNLAWHVALLWLPIEVRPVTAYLHIGFCTVLLFQMADTGKVYQTNPRSMCKPYMCTGTCVQISGC